MLTFLIFLRGIDSIIMLYSAFNCCVGMSCVFMAEHFLDTNQYYITRNRLFRNEQKFEMETAEFLCKGAKNCINLPTDIY